MRVINGIQYLRAVGAAMIIVEHAQQQVARHGEGGLPFTLLSGPAGVDIFFVISGFIIYLTTQHANPGPVDFWARRVVRIVPLYWIYTGSFLLVFALRSDLSYGFTFDPVHVLKSFLFIPGFHPEYSNYIWPALTPGWILNYEMFFYALFGLALMLPRGPRFRALGLALGGLVALGLWVEPRSAVGLVYTSPLLLEILAGILLGRLFLSRRRVGNGLCAVMLGLSLLLFVVGEIRGGVDNVGDLRRVLTWGIPALLLVAGVVLLERNGRMIENRVLRTLGDASYSIYLSHYFTLVPFAMIWKRIGLSRALPDWLMLLAAISVSMAAGWVAYRLLERPLTHRLNAAYRNHRARRSSALQA